MTCLDPSLPIGQVSFNTFTAKFSQKQISTKFPNFILSNFEEQMAPCKSAGRELLLNGHIIRFRPQTQKLESPYKTPSNTLAVKGLKVTCPTRKYTNPGRPDGTFFEPWMCLNSSPRWSNPESYPQLTNWWLEFVADTLHEDVMDCSRYVKLQEHLWQCFWHPKSLLVAETQHSLQR